MTGRARARSRGRARGQETAAPGAVRTPLNLLLNNPLKKSYSRYTLVNYFDSAGVSGAYSLGRMADRKTTGWYLLCQALYYPMVCICNANKLLWVFFVISFVPLTRKRLIGCPHTAGHAHWTSLWIQNWRRKSSRLFKLVPYELKGWGMAVPTASIFPSILKFASNMHQQGCSICFCACIIKIYLTI